MLKIVRYRLHVIVNNSSRDCITRKIENSNPKYPSPNVTARRQFHTNSDRRTPPASRAAYAMLWCISNTMKPALSQRDDIMYICRYTWNAAVIDFRERFASYAPSTIRDVWQAWKNIFSRVSDVLDHVTKAGHFVEIGEEPQDVK